MKFRCPLILPTVGLVLACAPRTVVVSSTPAGATPATSTEPGTAPVARTPDRWRVDVREHVDLWLHGFAMLQADSSLVPYFQLGYVDEVRRARGTRTRLDEHAAVLARRAPALTSAQFLAMYFGSWEDLRRGCQRFLRVNGEVRAAGDRETLRMYATLATYFPTAADRDWLRLFLEALDDERTRFHHAWWQQQAASRAGVRQEVDALWTGRYADAFGRFMRYNHQRTGAILLTLPLGAEGRSIDVGDADNFIAVPWPDAGSDARDALYVVAHEAVGTTTNQVVRDHTTPNDQQTGEAGRLSTLAAVRGGAILLERVAPDLADGYRRYYLRTARQVPAGDIEAQFARIFPLPAAMHAALVKQVDLILNGI